MERRRNSARRQGKAALLLTIASFAILLLFNALQCILPLSGMALLAARAFVSCLCFFVPAMAGLLLEAKDGDVHLPVRVLTAQQRLMLALAGVLFVCPAALLGDMPLALVHLLERGMGLALTGEAVPAVYESVLYLPTLLVSGLLVPFFEELFFRGYLMGALRKSKQTNAACALLFAAAHGVNAGFLPRLFLGLVLGRAMLQTDSVAAPMLLHMLYNTAVLTLGFMGMSEWVGGGHILSCVISLAGTLGFLAAYARLLRAPVARERITLWSGGKLKWQEAARLIVAVSVCVLSFVLFLLFPGVVTK